MVKRYSVLVLSVFGLFAAPLVLNGDPVKKRTEVTFNQPVEIPGMVLLSGDYVVKIPDPVTHGDMVGFYNTDETHLYKLARTIPAYRLDVSDKTEFAYEERTGGAPMAIKTWFYGGDHWGREFVYQKANVVRTAEAAPTAAPLAAEPAPEPIAEAAPAPEATVERVAETPEKTETIEIAELPLAAPLEARAEELPKTGSFMPLIGLLGVTALAMGALLRWMIPAVCRGRS
jgi:LPXTG-motif cell wall-anchored protein